MNLLNFILRRWKENKGGEVSMRTIEEVVNELKNMTEPSSESHYNSDVVYCQWLLDEILEIDKQNNESVKGNLVDRSAVIDVMWDVFNQYCNDADRFDEYETEAINRAFKLLQSVIEKQPTTNDSWIPCSERLPEIDKDVLLSLRSLDVYTGFRANTEGCFYVEGEGYVEFENVLAWQPLPAPYQLKGE